MERLRFDPYAPASQRYQSRQCNERIGTKSTVQQTSATSVPTGIRQENLAQAYITEQASVFPQYEVCEGWRKGSAFVCLDKPLEGVNRCGTR